MRLSTTLPWLLAPMLLAAPACAGRAAALSFDAMACLVKPKQVVQLGSPVFGVLSEVLVDRGDVVSRDQLVARLDSRVEDAQVALDRYRATNETAAEAGRVDLAYGLRELGRRQLLAGNMFSKANEIDEMTTKVAQAQIAIRKAEADQRTAALEAQRSESQRQLKMIHSPVDGVVTELKLAPGEYVYETTPIMTIAQVDPLTVDLVAPGEQYRAVRVGMVAQLRLETPVDETVPATVDAVDPLIDAASDTFRVRLTLPNPGNRIPAGVRCSVRLPDANG